MSGLLELVGYAGRPRLVILGSGWGAARLTKDVDCKLYDITVRHPQSARAATCCFVTRALRWRM